MTSIQIALSVGEPVKNSETWELKESAALIPKMISTTPPASKARDSIRVIIVFLSDGFSPRYEGKNDHNYSENDQNVDQPAHGGAGYQAKRPEYD